MWSPPKMVTQVQRQLLEQLDARPGLAERVSCALRASALQGADTSGSTSSSGRSSSGSRSGSNGSSSAFQDGGRGGGQNREQSSAPKGSPVMTARQLHEALATCGVTAPAGLHGSVVLLRALCGAGCETPGLPAAGAYAAPVADVASALGLSL
jgi:hypothetical protein